MGLFNWLFGKLSTVPTRDVIWLTDSARTAGVARAVNRHFEDGRSILLLAHFPSSLALFGEQLLTEKWPHAGVPGSLAPEAALRLAMESAPRVLYGLVRNLTPSDAAPREDSTPGRLPIIVLERHPLRQHDDRILDFAGGLGSGADVEFHISLDDPLMARFAGDWTRDLLRRLGLAEDQPIESAMVAKQIGAAQRKIAAGITNEIEAESAEEWLQRNTGQ